MTSSTKVSPNWLCPDCKAKIPRKDNSATPVKGPSDGMIVNSQSAIQLSPKTQSPAVNQSTVAEQTTEDPAANQPIQPLSLMATGTRELNVAYEIRCFREELGAMREELRQFRDEMASLKADVGLCRERMSVVEDKVAHLERRFEEKEPSSADHLEATIAELKLQLNERDQDHLLNDVIITGIPETKDESPLHLVHLVSSKLGISIDERDIVNAERIGMVRRNLNVTGAADAVELARPRALAVRLSRRAARDAYCQTVC
ncbi:hypothetical protein PYW07_001358 [Mythimna separata]|uniref:Zinc finger DNA binding protein n=1 Tax=Mythimna separata TaxID=271217 RepID=A0AAD7YUF3_MYTSE|nr:hypothetical protein PYW07_001358 [Mythimna separata]